MPHIKGLGHIDWDFSNEAPDETIMVWEEPGPDNNWRPGIFRPEEGMYARIGTFTYYPDKEISWVKAVLRPNFSFSLCFGCLNQDEHECENPCTQQLLRLRNLLSLCQERMRVTESCDGSLNIDLRVKGRVRSPESLMKAIVRRLSHD